MFIKLFSLILMCAGINSLTSYHCEHKAGEELSKTKCVAGRRFFARLDRNRVFKKIFSKDVLTQSYAFPWIAQVISNYGGVSSLCGGALINDRFVITAQQCCLPPLKPTNIQVVLGYTNNKASSRVSSCSIQSNVLNIILHPGYDSYKATPSNNIALLELGEVSYTRTIYPVQLPSKLDKFMDWTHQQVEGAGYKINPPSSFNRFGKSVMKIIDNEVCSSYGVTYKDAVNSEILCADNVDNDKTMCESVPGTPLMMEKTQGIDNVTILVGIVSWNGGVNTASTNSHRPVVYVRIDKKLPWILQHTANALYCRN